jgi:hypothetical protein
MYNTKISTRNSERITYKRKKEYGDFKAKNNECHSEVVGIICKKILATIEEVLSMKFPFIRDLGKVMAGNSNRFWLSRQFV